MKLTPQQWERVRKTIATQVEQQLYENESAVIDAMARAETNHDGKGQFKYKLAVGIELTPTVDVCMTTTTLSFAVREHHEDSVAVRIGGPDMVDKMGEGK